MRIEGRGRLIDRERPVQFSFDGRSMTGFAGDTVASALLAGGVRLLGRSFKYHRPRGVLCVGAQEPNALITTGSGAGQTPNLRATMQEIHEGLQVRSQNRWPSLRHDLRAFSDLAAPLLSAGFYYKTFMWPRRAWERLYEPLIRRAAGLGALSGQDDRTPRDAAWAFCDLLVIGGGPAGLVAALQAARAGADVILADENPAFGGQLLGEDEQIGGHPAQAWIAKTLARLEAAGTVRLMPRTTVLGAYDQGTYGAVELAAPQANGPPETFWRIVARRAVLCAGAHERLVAFPGNDRPGVMLAGAVRGFLHRYGVVPGRRVAIFAGSDDGWRTARDLQAAGVRVAALIDSRATVPNAREEGDFPVFTGARVTGTRGRLGLRRVRVEHAGGTEWAEADCLAVSGGWNPALHLSSHLGARPVWNAAIAAFVPAPAGASGMEVAGAAAGVFGTYEAMKSGAYRAKILLEDLGFRVPPARLPRAERHPGGAAPLWHVPGRGRAWLDLQNDVTVRDLALAVRENYASAEHMKRYTTLGMAPDQGKSGAVTAMAVLAGMTDRPMADIGTTTFRPPYAPVSIAAMGADGLGRRFAPERLSPADAASRDMGAPMAEAGLWLRPLCFPRPPETHWRQSCDREVMMVREKVGVADVSTLGKVEVLGKNAAQFLDFVYVNGMSDLRAGQMRYGAMLRDDGFVLDDGTCARLGRGHFLLTTTTAAASEVLAHLEFCAQCLHPDWDVKIVPVTEQWAQIALAGPLALELVNSIVEQAASKEDMPFMSWRRVTVSGIGARLFRVSFSGELGYEIAVPSGYGDSLFRLATAQAEAMGGGAYGLEAMNVLRLEKGFLTHAEIDGRRTADDLGLGWMERTRSAACGKDFIGRRMSRRPALVASGREQLVGLRPVGAVRQLSAGASLFDPAAPPTHENIDGHSTSAAYSPTLGRSLALALLRDGRARHGQRIRLLDRLRGLDVICEVTAGVAHDPKGERMRG